VGEFFVVSDGEVQAVTSSHSLVTTRQFSEAEILALAQQSSPG
jgi:hypothetical protein